MTTSRLERGRRRADPRLPAYLVAGFGALIAAIALGQPGLAALGAPFIALATIGVAGRRPVRLSGQVNLRSDRVVEGDIIEGEVSIDWDGQADVDVILPASRATSPVDPLPATSWSLSGTGPATLPFRIRAEFWGRHDLGSLWVRTRRPGSLTAHEHRLAAPPVVQILPAPLRLGRLLKPAEPRAVAGMHLSRYRGQGTDFAELRPYRPGDRLRDLSWATSARLDEPWVTVRHSERTGTVLLLLDAVYGDERRSTESLARAARTGWAVASVHLRAQDRVGLLARGRTTAWLPPHGGRRARYMLLDELLAIGRAAEDLHWRPRRGGRATLPHDALVVAITSLQSRDFIHELLHFRRAGHTAVALVVDDSDLLPDDGGIVDEAARRIWLASRETNRHSLERGGIATALVTVRDGVGPAISSLRRRMATVRSAGTGAASRSATASAASRLAHASAAT
jgi:uncharacterized protein (DUF58 family)